MERGKGFSSVSPSDPRDPRSLPTDQGNSHSRPSQRCIAEQQLSLADPVRKSLLTQCHSDNKGIFLGTTNTMIFERHRKWPCKIKTLKEWVKRIGISRRILPHTPTLACPLSRSTAVYARVTHGKSGQAPAGRVGEYCDGSGPSGLEPSPCLSVCEQREGKPLARGLGMQGFASLLKNSGGSSEWVAVPTRG